MRLSPSDTT